MKQINTSVYTNWRKSIFVFLIGVKVLLVFLIYQKESSTKNAIFQKLYKILQNKPMFVIVLQNNNLLNNRNTSLLSLGTISQSLSCTSHNKWSITKLK